MSPAPRRPVSHAVIDAIVVGLVACLMLGMVAAAVVLIDRPTESTPYHEVSR